MTFQNPFPLKFYVFPFLTFTILFSWFCSYFSPGSRSADIPSWGGDILQNNCPNSKQHCYCIGSWKKELLKNGNFKTFSCRSKGGVGLILIYSRILTKKKGLKVFLLNSAIPIHQVYWGVEAVAEEIPALDLVILGVVSHQLHNSFFDTEHVMLCRSRFRPASVH